MSKKLIILCLILIFFTAVSFVSADDVNQEMLSATDSIPDASVSVEASDVQSSSGDNSLLNAKNNDTVLKESNTYSFSDLNTKIANTATGGTLELEENEIYINDDNYSSTGIVINKKITINGNGATIDANEKGRIFQITGTGVTLNNITFINGQSNQGGAVYWNGNDGMINNSVFKYNTATQHGGAVYWYKTGGKIDNCDFSYNTATTYGGAIYWNANNGALTNSNFTGNYANQGAVRWGGTGGVISNNIFTNNYGISYGALRTENAVTIKNSQFINNTAANGGDMITSTNHKVTVDNCSFYGSHATGTGQGGAINHYDGQLTIINSVFNGTYAYGGGAIASRNSGTNRIILNISNTNFTNINTGVGHGTIRFDSNAMITVSDCYFINNTANVSGNAVGAGIFITRSANVDSKVSNCNFINNSNGRGVLYFDGVCTVEDCTFVGNQATGTATLNSGNCIYTSKSFSLSNCDFINNTGVKAIVYLNAASLNFTISECNFINNTNINTNAAYGGTVNSVGNLAINDSNFTGNTIGTNGGAIYAVRNLTVDASNFINNSAGSNGGAIYTTGNLTLVGSIFTDNNVSANGGAIYTTENMTVDASSFTNNSAGSNGGAIFTNCPTTTSTFDVKNSEFKDNKAGSFIDVKYDEDKFNVTLYSYNNLMNAIYLSRVDELTLSNNYYWNGTRRINSDIRDYTNFNPLDYQTVSDETINVTVTNSEGTEISTSYVTDSNGQISVSYGSYDNCTFVLSHDNNENNAFKAPDVTVSTGGDFFKLKKFIDTKIAAGETVIKLNRNYTYTKGVDTITNGITIGADDIVIDGDGFTVDANFSSRIFNITGNNVLLKNILLVNGTAYDGGAVYWTGRKGTIKNSTFIDNTVTHHGGAVYWNSYNGTVYNSTFIGNNATSYGGSLYLEVPTADCYDIIDNFIVNKSSFSNGHTNSWGGAVFIQRSGTVDLSTFEDLYSTTGAGALYANRNLNVQNSKFNNTHSGSTGGGAICLNWASALSVANIANCTFNNSYATYGGALRVYGNINVNDSTFSNCYATGHSGVLIMENRGNSSFNNCVFDNNYAATYTGVLYLRGVYSNITNCNFTNNYENTTGNGNIYVAAAATILDISDSRFINNSAVNGGVIRTLGASTINTCTFINNTAVNDGGVIYTTGANLTIENSNFTGNGANRGSAVYSTSANVSVTSCSFINNTVGSFIVVKDNNDTNEYVAVLYQRNNLMNAFYIASVKNLTISDSSYWNRTSMVYIDSEYYDSFDSSFIRAPSEIITVTVSDNNGVKSVTNYTTDDNGETSSISYAGHGDRFTFTHTGLEGVDYDFNNISVVAGSTGFDSLQLFLDTKIAEGETTIVLTKDYTYDLNSDTIVDGVVISADNLVIDGNGFTIDALYASRIFNITGNNVTLQNFKFINGFGSDNGGAIYWTGNEGVINNSNFANNTANSTSNLGGGALYSSVKLSIFNSNFTNNNISYRGGAVYVNSALTLENCIFINNTAVNHGGAVVLNGAANISYSKFINNSAKQAAGALYNINAGTGSKAGGTISYCEFTNNTAATNGGASYLTPTQTTVTYCNFTGNTATTGGAIYNYHRQLITTYCNYDNNRASGEGGAVYIYSYNANYQSTITGCNFTSNSGTIGGAVRTRGTLAITNSHFINNTATTGNGGACSIYSWNVITNGATTNNCYFENNTAKTDGGAVYSLGTYTVTSSNFTNNSAANGGAVYSTGAALTINTNSKFANNSAVNGGAVYSTGAGLTINTNSNFANNSAVNGGAVYTTCTDLMIFSSVFTNNTADKGSALYLNNMAYITITKTNFTINQANSEFIDRVNDGENLTATLILYNHVMSAIYCNPTPSVLLLINDNYWNGTDIVNSNRIPAFESLSDISTIYPNKTVTVYAKDANNQTIDTFELTTDENGQVKFNYAKASFERDPKLIIFKYEAEPDYYRDGDFTGAFSFSSAFNMLQEFINREIALGHYEINLTRDYIYDIGFDTITGGIFIDANNVVIDGRGYVIDALNSSRIFYINSTQNVTLKNMVLINANVNSSNLINVNGSLIKVDATQGGSIYVANNISNLVIDNLDFINTSSSNVGGAIYAVAVSNLNLSNCLFVNTTSSDVGSAVQLDWAYNIDIRDSKFINSTGGSIMLNSGSYNTIRNCSFANIMMGNQQNIGSIRVDKVEHTLIDSCNFTDSRGYWGVGVRIARTGNGYVYNLTINNCNFINLTNPSAGGAVYTAGHNSGDNVSYVQIYNCYFERCSQESATGRGSAMELNAHHSSVVNCTLVNNIAYGAGTIGLYSTASYAYIANCVFINNTALGNAGGGAISAELAACNNANIFNCTFINNSAPNSKGGALVFNARDSSITNCTFIENHALTHGGAISFNANNGYILRCSFIKNHADGDGGAICSYSVNNTIDNCTFDSNTAPDGPDFYAHPGCSLVFVGTVFSTIFVGDDNLPADYSVSNSHGLRSGDPITWDNAFSYLESVGITENIVIILINNNDNDIGVRTTIANFTEKTINIGGVTVRGWNSSSIVNLTGWNHRAFTINANSVTFADLTFVGSNIQNLSSDNDGGVLKFINCDGAQIINCTFTGNYAVRGGAISLNNSNEGRAFLIDSCMFNYNNATGPGGAVWFNNVTNLTMVLNSYFQHNRALDGYSAGGGIYYQPSIRYYIDSFTYDESNSFDNQLNITNDNPLGGPSAFTDGSQTLLKYIYVSWANGDSNSNGSEWNHPTTFSRGFELIAPTGTIYFVAPEVYDYARIFPGIEHIVDCEKFNITFLGNNSVISGITMRSVAGFGYGLVIANLTFANNNFTPIINCANDNTIVNCSFIDNNCSAIINEGANLIINNTRFVNNNLNGTGAAVYSNASNLTIYNCDFKDNNATMGGSHLYLTENSNNTVIYNSTFNNGLNSGIVSYANGLQINASKFINNKGLYGGALLILNGTDIILSNNNFTDNSAVIGGGAIFTNVSVCFVDCNFTNNHASLGGALYINASDCELSALKFTSNVADIGAAILFDNVSSVIFNNSAFINNVANDMGIVYFAHDANVYNDENLIFTGNNLGNEAVNIVVANGVELNATVFFVNNVTNAGATGIAGGIDATSLEYACGHVLDVGKILFAKAVYVLDDTIDISNKTVALVGNGSSIKRNNSKYLFTIDNSTVAFKNLTLDAGIDVYSGIADLNNITFTATDAGAGGIVYEAGSTGSIVDSKFSGTTALDDIYLVTVNGNVVIDNTEFTNNTVGALRFNGSGSVTDSKFVGNKIDGVVRNVNVTNVNDVIMSNNTYDAVLTYNITNNVIGAEAAIDGTYDAGVNFALKDVKFMINDTLKTNKTADVREDGKFTFDITGELGVGTYNLTVANNPFVTYNTTSFDIIKNEITVNSLVNVTVVYGMNDTINIRGTVNASSYSRYNGKVNITISSTVTGKEIHLYDVKVNNNIINANIVDKGTLTAGSYDVTISCDYDENYDFITAVFSNNVTVVPATIAVQSVDDMSIVYGNNDTIVVKGSVNNTKYGDNYAGSVTVSIDGTSISGSGVVDNNGNFAVAVNVSKINAGEYDVVVSIDGNENYNPVSGESFADKLNVANATIAVQSVDNINVAYGNNKTIVVKGSVNNTKYGDNYTGSVTVSIDGTSISGSGAVDNNGNFAVVINNAGKLDAGKYGIVVSIDGNENYNPVSGELFADKLNVANATIAVQSVTGMSIVYGNNNSIIVKGNVNNTKYGDNYTGSVTVSIDGTSISGSGAVDNNGNFAVVINNIGKLDAGKYGIVVSINGSKNYNAVNGKLFANKLDITKATIDVQSVDDISIVYGNNNSIIVKGNVNNTKYGDNYTGSVTVSISGSGISGSGAVDNNGNFAIAVNVGKLDAGKYDIAVSIGGNKNYNAVSGRLFVDKLNVANATIAVQAVNDINVAYGNSKTIVVKGSVNNTKYGDNYTGSVTVSIDGTSISGSGTVDKKGNFAVVLNNVGKLDAGKYGIVVSIDGNKNYNAVSGELFADKLNVANATIAVQSVDNINIAYGNNKTIVVKGNVNNTKYGDNYTGSVTVSIDGTSISGSGTVDNNGNFEVVVNNIDNLGAGKYGIVVSIDGSENYNAVNGKLFADKLNIAKSSIEVQSVDDMTIVYGNNNSIVVKGTVNNTKYGDNYTGFVTVIIDGPAISGSGAVDNKGNFAVVISDANIGKLNVGEYGIVVSIDGNENYNPVSGKLFDDKLSVVKASIAVQSVEDISIVYGSNNSVIVKGTVNSTKFGNNYTDSVSVSIDGKNISGSSVVDNNGNFAVVLNNVGKLDVAKYDLTVSIDGDWNYNAVSGKLFDDKLSVVKASIAVQSVNNITIVYGNNNSIIVKGTVNNTKFGAEYTDQVSVSIDGSAISGSGAVDNKGNFAVVVDGTGKLDAGKYGIVVSIGGNENYNAADGELFADKLNVVNATIAVQSVEDITVAYGNNNSILIKGTVNNTIYGDNYTGPVTVVIDGTGISVNGVVDNKGSFTVVVEGTGKLDAGKYNIVVSIGGSDNYNAVGDEFFADKLNIVNATIAVQSVEDISIVYGNNDSVVVKGSVNSTKYGDNYTGLVTVSIDGSGISVSDVVDDNGNFAVVINGTGKLYAGKYAIAVSIAGSDNYNAVDNLLFADKLNVANATIAVQSVDDISIVYGNNDSVVVKGSVNSTKYGDNYTGLVTVVIDGSGTSASDVVDNNGNFAVVVNGTGKLDAGNHTIAVSIDGADNYNAVSEALFNNKLVVAKASIAVQSVDNITIVYGVNNSIVVRGNVNNTLFGENYTGLMNITICETQINGSNATSADGNFTIWIENPDLKNLNVNNYSVYVEIIGNNNYENYSTVFSNVLEVIPARTAITIDVDDVVYNNTAVVNFNVSNIDSDNIIPTEIVAITVSTDSGIVYTVNSTTDAGSVELPILDVENYTVTIVYDGDDNFAGSNSSYEFIVSIMPTTVSLDDSYVVIGNNVTVTTANITDGSMITLKINGKKYYGIVRDNSASILIDSASSTGTLVANVSYAGTNNRNASYSLSDIELISPNSLKALQLLIDESDDTIVLDQDYVYDPNTDDGGVVINKSITIDGNNHTIDANGMAPVFNITSDNVNVSDITYANANGTIIDVNANNVSITNSSFVNNTAVNANLIDASGTNGTVLSGNEFIGNNLTNSSIIDLSNSNKTTVENITLAYNDVDNGTLIDVSNSTDSVISGTEISDNDLSDSVGIDVSGSDGVSVEDTVVSGC